MRKVLSLSMGALAVLLLTVALLGCGGGKSAPTGTNLKSMPAGSDQSVDDVLAELEALEPPEGVDPVLFDQLKEELGRQLGSGGGKIVSAPSGYAINDFLEVIPLTDPPTVTWSSDNFIADGSLNAVVGIEDITPIAMYYGLQWDDPAGDGYEPLAKLGDYARDGTVGIEDITPLAITYGQDTAGYIVEWALDDGAGAPVDDYTSGGQILYDEHLVDTNENGFFVYEFQFAVAQLPDVAGVWVRVVPYDTEDTRGLPSDPSIWIVLGTGPVVELFVTDMLIQVAGTNNTEAGDYVDTEFYVAPDAGGDTFGEAPANEPIDMVLSDIAFLYESVPYEFGTYPGDLPIGDLTIEIFDGIMAQLQDYMNYTVASTEVPPDAEAWEADAEQPDIGYSGRLGPNDLGSLMLTAIMPDNIYTQSSASFIVTIDLTLNEDVNAPEVRGFEPATVAQNKTEIITVRVDWGEDEVGDEVPMTLALYDTADWTVTYTFVFDAETPDYPTIPGEYTLQRVPPNPEFTTNLYVLVSGAWFEPGHEYKWRVSEDEAGFERRSSLKKPVETFSVTGPEYVDMFTWPEDEFYTLDTRQQFIYFFPEDPLIRRNPEGHPTEAAPPAFEYDDPDAFDDLIKADGNEFTIIYGQPDPPMPGAPVIAYSWGATPPATLAAADGELPLTYQQPHMLAGAVAVLHDTAPVEGDVSFSRFSKEGTLLGTCTRWKATMQIPRGAPIVTGGDFGVDPWGPDGTAAIPVFTDKVADQDDRDVVIFTYYNAWMRHNDTTLVPQQERGTHLILIDSVSSAQLPDIILEPRMVADSQGGMCWSAIEVGRTGNTDLTDPPPYGKLWWQNIEQLITVGTYDVRLENPGAGSADYPDTLTITP